MQSNALKRVRSSGMISRKFLPGRNNDSAYHTDTKQYLISRNKTFNQNQYKFIRIGDSINKPGTAFTQSNIYSPNGFSHCNKLYISADCDFQYQWTHGGASGYSDTSPTTVSVPSGYYDIYELNQLLKNTMDSHAHYYYNIMTKSYVYLLNISYNIEKNTIELQTYFTNDIIFPSNKYSTEGGVTIIPSSLVATNCPYFIISSTMATIFGIPVGCYPENGGIGNTSILCTTDQTYRYESSSGNTIMLATNSTSIPTIGISPYKKLYYKPNNSQFAQQGAVSGSSYITRKIYNTVSENTMCYYTSYGSSVANEMAYGINDSQRYTIKAKIGVQSACTPVISGSGNTLTMGSTCNYKSRR
jgi:hypothetical protein